MAALHVTCGLPGSGKTTQARAWVAEAPEYRTRVNRDDLRRMLHGHRLGTPEQEDQVTAAQLAAVEALLGSGWDVVCDDTNLRADHVERFRVLAEKLDAGFKVLDLTGVPLWICRKRNARRRGPARVPAEVIDQMWRDGIGERLHHLGGDPLKPRPLSSFWDRRRAVKACRRVVGHCWHPEDLTDWWCCMCPAETDGMPAQGCTYCATTPMEER